MKLIHRLRASGVVLAATLALAACSDGFFFDPAPAGLTPITLQATWVPAGDGPQPAGAGEAFDKADGARVVVRTTDREFFNQAVALTASGADRKIDFEVELPAGSAVAATIEVTLSQGSIDLFEGSASRSLTPGQAAEVEVPISGVVGSVSLNTEAVTLRILGETFPLSTTGLFATGDTLGVVNATYQVLGSAVSVASNGIVTAVGNGLASVVATYLGKSDTVAITVDDRCVPGELPPLGSSFDGILDDLDCALPDDPTSRVGDWFSFTLAEQTAVKFSLASPDYVPRWWLYEETAPGRAWEFEGYTRAHQLDDSIGFEAAILPPGEYRIFIYSAPFGPLQRGSYTFTSELISEDNDFLCPVKNGKGVMWLTPGYRGDQDLGGGCTGNESSLINQDRFGVHLEAGVEYVVRTSVPLGNAPEIRFVNATEELSSGMGDAPYQEFRYTPAPDKGGWHGLVISAVPNTATGPYYISFAKAEDDVDPCASVATIEAAGSISGTLDYRDQCFFDKTLVSEYRTFSLDEETSYLVELTAETRINWGVVEPSGPIDGRRRFVTGSSLLGPSLMTLPTGDYALFVSSYVEDAGDWTLNSAEVDGDLNVGCNTRVHVVPGFSGMRSLNDACIALNGRNQDRYRIRLQGGQSYTASVASTDIETELLVFAPGGVEITPSGSPTREGRGPQDAIGPGLSNTFTFTAPETNWYSVVVQSALPELIGTYTFEFVEGVPSGTASLSGTVTLDGSPVSGVTVTLSGPVTASGVTDALGNYAIAGLALGSYSVSFAGLPSEAVMDPVSPILFDVPGQSRVVNFTGTLVTTGTIQGTVTAEGTPLAGVIVLLDGPGVSLNTVTDASGQYAFTDLDAGTYTVGVSGAPADVVFPVNGVNVSLVAGATLVQDFDGLILRNSSIGGEVTGDGFPLAGVPVTLTGPDGPLVVSTGGSGLYNASGLRPGDYTVSIDGFWASAYDFPARSQLVVLPLNTAQVVSFTGAVVPEPLFDVSIVVSSDPNDHEPSIQMTPVDALHAEVREGDMASIFSLITSNWVDVSGTANADGTFTLNGTGTVAGFPNIDVIFEGEFVFDGTMITGFTGTLTVGPGNQLPADGSGNFNPAIYTVTATRAP